MKQEQIEHFGWVARFTETLDGYLCEVYFLGTKRGSYTFSKLHAWPTTPKAKWQMARVTLPVEQKELLEEALGWLLR